MWICKNCDTKNEDHNLYCSCCGEEITKIKAEEDQDDENPSQNNKTGKEESGSRWTEFLGCGVVFVFFLIMYVLSSGGFAAAWKDTWFKVLLVLSIIVEGIIYSDTI